VACADEGLRMNRYRTPIVSYGTEGSGGAKQAQAQLAQIADFVGIGLVRPGVRISLPNEAHGADGRIADPHVHRQTAPAPIG
jgi:hypothetical protein